MMSKAKTSRRMYLGVTHTWLSGTSWSSFLSTEQKPHDTPALSVKQHIRSTTAGTYRHLSDKLFLHDLVFSFSNTKSHPRLRQQSWESPVPELNCFTEWSSCTLGMLQQHLLFPALGTYLRFIVLRSLTPLSSPSTAWAPGQLLNLFNQSWVHSSLPAVKLPWQPFWAPLVLCVLDHYFSARYSTGGCRSFYPMGISKRRH